MAIMAARAGVLGGRHRHRPSTIDALQVKMRTKSGVTNRSVFIAMGVCCDGTEGAKFWLSPTHSTNGAVPTGGPPGPSFSLLSTLKGVSLNETPSAHTQNI